MLTYSNLKSLKRKWQSLTNMSNYDDVFDDGLILFVNFEIEGCSNLVKICMKSGLPVGDGSRVCSLTSSSYPGSIARHVFVQKGISFVQKDNAQRKTRYTINWQNDTWFKDEVMLQETPSSISQLSSVKLIAWHVVYRHMLTHKNH